MKKNFKNTSRYSKEEQYKKKWQFLNTDQRINRLNEYYARNCIRKDNVIIKKLSELAMKRV